MHFPKHSVAGALLLALIVPILAACGGQTAQQEPIRETVVVEVTSQPEVQTVVVTPEGGGEAAEGEATAEGDTTTEPAAGGEGTEAYTTPHPILGDVNVRRAIAYCTNRPEVIASVYPFLSEDEQQQLLMDTFLPQGHWARNADVTKYPFDPEQGSQLLEDAGWALAEGDDTRANADGDPLSLSFTTTNAQFRQTWSAVFIQQMQDNCGIQIIPTYAPGSWWFGSSTGLARRDFELGAFAWVGEADPGGQTLYSCNQIPLASNNWEGQNYMGWCSDDASRAIQAANNSLDRETRIKDYAIVQEKFAEDMVSLPMFNRTEAAAANNRFEGFQPDPTEYYTSDADTWSVTDGDTLVLGFTQEPQSMFTLVESAAVQRTAAYLIGNFAGQGFSWTEKNYDYQPGALTEIPTIESGGATLTEVEMSEGDTVWSADGEAVELADGVEVLNSEGETVAFEGEPITMNQIAVTYEYPEGITWSDGEPLKQADFELAETINCDPDSGATSFTVCDSTQGVEYTSDTSYTTTFLPGAVWPEYFTFGVTGAYPSHQVLADGRNLADVPASEWSTLPEMAETPLSLGPYTLESWEKGQRMVFQANPNYYKGEPAVKTIIVQFVADTNQAVAQLLTGEIDALGTETLGAGAEVQSVLDAAEQGNLSAFTVASPTWEHIDMNLFIR